MEVTAYHLWVVAVLLAVAAFWAVIRSLSRRIESVHDLPRDARGFQFTARVTRVADGDGFRALHVPTLNLWGGAVPRRCALSIRLAGIDAPEMAHFGHAAQAFAKEATACLSALVLGKRLRIHVLGIDRYGRILAFAFLKTGWFGTRNINLAMVKAGFACVYNLSDAQFGTYEAALRAAEAVSRKKRLGMWKARDLVLPMDYKKKMRKAARADGS